jgi:hypothetical protein
MIRGLIVIPVAIIAVPNPPAFSNRLTQKEMRDIIGNGRGQCADF